MVENEKQIYSDYHIYAATEIAYQAKKDKFYENLINLCEGLPKKEDIILLGDANS